jgi:medium-chain acyl-[acyl-carrier-protein] hydrolase
MQTFLEETHKIRTYDVDFNNRLKVSSIFNYMQDIAAEHADRLNFGYKDLKDSGLFWVLYWVKVKFEGFPKFEDKFTIKTWAKGKYKLYALRDFLLLNEKNEIFCRATSAWLLLNADTRRITDIKNLPSYRPALENEHALKDLPSKITVENKKESVFKKHVGYSSIDINQHVNNEKYIEFILDCYPEEFHIKNQIKNLTVSFLSETKFDDWLEIYLNKNIVENNTDYIEGVNQKNQKPVFQSLIEWKSV